MVPPTAPSPSASSSSPPPPLQPPTVLYPLTLPRLLDYILSTQPTNNRLGDTTIITPNTTLIICSSRDLFLRDLAQSLYHTQENDNAQEAAEAATPQTTQHRLGSPSLRNLFTARHVRLTFCASVSALLAHLTAGLALPAAPKLDGDSRGSCTRSPSASASASAGANASSRHRIVLVNPLALHAPTPSFSAQGLSRTFAAAAEAAARQQATLLLVECTELARIVPPPHVNHEAEDAEMADPGEEIPVRPEDEDPWEQEVSILNVSARRFGSGHGDRAWAGRTVKAKRIAARWFQFHKLESSHVRENAV